MCLVLSQVRTENGGMKNVPLIIIMALLTGQGSSQTSDAGSQTQQQILNELRAIHRDLRASTTLQLLLAQMQITQTTLDRAIQRRDTLKAQEVQLLADRSSAQAQVARFQGGVDKVANPDQQFVDRLDELKEGLRRLTTQEAANAEQLEDAESRLRTAQAERGNVQGQLSDLVKKLDALN